MKNKNKKNSRFSILGYAFISLFLVVFQIFGQTAAAFTPVKQLAFESAKTVLENNSIQEIRQTEDGNIIQRFYTGLKETPFVDYLLLKTSEGTVSFVPIRENMMFLENTKTYGYLETLKEIFLSKKLQIEKIVIAIFLSITVFIIHLYNPQRFYQKNLLFPFQSLWLTTRRIRI